MAVHMLPLHWCTLNQIGYNGTFSPVYLSMCAQVWVQGCQQFPSNQPLQQCKNCYCHAGTRWTRPNMSSQLTVYCHFTHPRLLVCRCKRHRCFSFFPNSFAYNQKQASQFSFLIGPYKSPRMQIIQDFKVMKLINYRSKLVEQFWYFWRLKLRGFLLINVSTSLALALLSSSRCDLGTSGIL